MPQMSPMFWVVFPLVMMMLVMIVLVIIGEVDSVKFKEGLGGEVLMKNKRW